ncbi:MAG: phosphoesterase [Myxococcales bacterium]|nr:phosphoesterase [Myxococcales bacterium]
MPDTDLRIFFHERCFDGATTAALFGHFYRSTRGQNAVIDYWGMAHSDGDPFENVPWGAEVNACVDFRYSADPRMHWWFDHHQSAFQPSELREHFDATLSATKFYDPHARSCALFAHQVMTQRLGFVLEDSMGHWEEVLSWADRIDGAVFDSARQLVELDAPALRFMTWLRSNRDRDKMAKTIEMIGRHSLAEIENQPWVAEQLPGLLQTHHHSVAIIRERIEVRGPVAIYDLADDNIEVHSGFAAYLHEPTALYSIGLVYSARGARISVGCNPWAETPGTRNIAEICERYGGGGHPKVGGISVPAGQLARAREIVAEVAAELAA